MVHPLRGGTAEGIAGPSPAPGPGVAVSTAGGLALWSVPVIRGKRGTEHPGHAGHVLLRIPPPRVALDVAHPMFSQLPDHCYVKECLHGVTVSPELAIRIGETAGHLTGHPTNQATVPLGEGERPAGSVRYRLGFAKGAKSNSGLEGRIAGASSGREASVRSSTACSTTRGPERVARDPGRRRHGQARAAQLIVSPRTID